MCVVRTGAHLHSYTLHVLYSMFMCIICVSGDMCVTHINLEAETLDATNTIHDLYWNLSNICICIQYMQLSLWFMKLFLSLHYYALKTALNTAQMTYAFQ